MEIKHSLLLFFLGIVMVRASISNVDINGVRYDYGIGALNRSSFPAEFIFGSGSAAYQYEGAAHQDGRGPSIWDTFTHKLPGKIIGRSNGDVAIDQYHRYKEDVKMIKDMGLDAYRFSISWSRVLPYGKVSKGVNKKGVMYYHSLIDELLANGLTPFVTLFHWDLPQALENAYGGFLNQRVVNDFEEYADFCFREFGSKVKYWTTLNEPFSYSYNGYARGSFAPGRCSAWQNLNCTGGDSATEPYLVTHHLLLSHAAAVHLYRKKYQPTQKGLIGITLVTHWFVPYTEVEHNRNAAARVLDFFFGWFMNPITYGEYPHSMRSIVKQRLPQFSAQQSQMVKGSFDFLGLNYYASQYARYASGLRSARPSYENDMLASLAVERNGVPIGPAAGSDWLRVYPKGIRELLVHIKTNYGNPPIYITENGYDDLLENMTIAEALDDKMRVRYHHDHLVELNVAIKEGVHVKGYFQWSFFDDFEWDAGYSVGFGLNYIDRKHGLKRYPKLSAHWFKKFLQS